MTKDKVKPDSLKSAIRAADLAEKDLVVTVRLANTASRALHYVAEVRAIRYDPEATTLTLALSDEGRELIPQAAGVLPKFRHIDPGSEAELQLKVPNRVIKLSRTVPPGELAFVTYPMSDAEQVVVEIAWADVPYYKDTRAREDKRLPAARWEQHKARSSFRLKGTPPSAA